MLARRRDLFQIVEHLLTVVDMGGRKRGEADGRAFVGVPDVVRHIGQKFALGAVSPPFPDRIKLGSNSAFFCSSRSDIPFSGVFCCWKALFRSSPHERGSVGTDRAGEETTSD